MKVSELEKKIDLLSLIKESHKPKSLGSNTYRVNPCPVCKGNDHFTIYPETNSYSSYSDCCQGGSVYKYLIEVEQMDEDQAHKRLHTLSGTPEHEREANYDIQILDDSTATVETNKRNYTDYITKLHEESISKFPKEMGEAFLNRGITVNEIQKYKLSIFKDNDGLRAMLPVWSNGEVLYYTTRALEGQKIKYKNSQGGATNFFNMDYLTEPQDEPIIITEGIMDALSLEYLGYKAMALHGVQSVSNMWELVKRSPNAKNTLFLTAFDNDEAGQSAANYFKYKSIKIPQQYSDINEWHIDSLINAQDTPEDFKSISDDINKQMESARQPNTVSDYLDSTFYSDIDKMKPYKNKKTGFSNLDKELSGLFPGLYVVGGISSVGKTTFVHQLGDQLAELGDHVIFFSLEQSVMEMASKSLARTTAKNDLNSAVSSVSIRGGYKSDAVKSALTTYKPVGKRMSVIEGNFDTDMKDIREYVERYATVNNTSPIVIVDYLQIMPGLNDRMSDKERVDVNVKMLKQMSRDLNLSVFVISSLNRGNYLMPIDFESFKESGGIEYTADVVLGLQLEAINDNIFNSANKIKEKREMLAEAKSENPRQIELVCLKNRNGKPSFTCSFTYYASYDYYEPNKAVKEDIKPFTLDFSDMSKPVKKEPKKQNLSFEEIYEGINRVTYK